MLQICRAEDGEVFQVNTTVWEIERAGSLEDFLQEETGVDREAVLAYLSDGKRLRSDNIRDLAGAPDETIFVFNKFYLDYDLDEVLRELRVEPRLQASVEDAISSTPPFRPTQVAAAYLRAAHAHHDTIVRTAAAILHQHSALGIASRSLDLHILNITDAFDAFAVGARRELDKQAALLAGLEIDLEVVARVRIHPEFMSLAVRRAVEAGEKARTLGDYVSNAKMRQVAEGCAKTHNDLKLRFDQAQEAVTSLTEGAEQVRAALMSTRVVENADACQRRAQELVDKITDAAAVLESPASNHDGLLQELRQFDAVLRKEVEGITDAKNSSTELCITTLRRISTLNTDLVQLPATMGVLQADFRVKTSFAHIQRLHNMLYAYGATLVEIVRRKEFARFFYQRSQTILEVMAKLSASERKRRQIYRGDVHGQLPFEAKGMGDQVPMIDFSPAGKVDAEYSLERGDIDAFLSALDAIEKSLEPRVTTNNHPILDTRQALMKLISRIDGLESTFDRIVERSVLSASRLSQSRRRLTEAEEAAIHELAEQLQNVQQAKEDQETAFLKQQHVLEVEISRLQADLQEAHASAEAQRDRADGLERDLHLERAQNESETTARRVMEHRLAEQLTEADDLRQSLARALADATEQSKVAERLRQEAAQARAEFEEVKRLEATNSKKISQLLEDQATTLRNLDAARVRGEDLQAQIQAARSESYKLNHALTDASEQKERLLRMQEMEHERALRDHIAEADGDRAVLERQFAEVKAQLDDCESRLKEARADTEILQADASGLREELQRTEHDLREARHAERVLRADLSAGMASQSDFERRLQNSDKLIAQMTAVAIAFHDSHTKVLSAVQAMSAHPGSGSKSAGNLGDSMMSSGLRPLSFMAHGEPTPIDATDPEGALDGLRAFDHDLFFESISKVGSVIRKWQKQCKEYRERAKGKISFRNFAKGDLALFLPTRNSVSKPWAAFNVSFPHYFLQATGRLAEQLKTREWIVARITSITERIADQRDPGSNPYGLGDGVKYYMLEVEDWTQPGNAAKRRPTSNRKTSAATDIMSSSPPERPISPPPADLPQPGPSSAESLGATRSPTSHLFPVRNRANSTTAGPSSLSRLLAQASPAEGTLETISSTPERTHSPTTSLPPPPASPTRQVPHDHSPSVPSPLRPGSRASSTSRFSVTGRIPPFPGSVSSGSSAIPKAAPTTALSSDTPIPSPTSSYHSIITAAKSRDVSPNQRRPTTPSPTHSASEGMSSVLWSRRRTTSEHIPALSRNASLSSRPSVGTSASNALANLASGWIGRRKQSDGFLPEGASGSASDSGGDSMLIRPPSRTAASDLLKRF